MANFEEAYKLTGHNEGGYDNDPDDHGGETFAGIARNFWPAWSGWAIIDAYKKAHGGVAGIDKAMFADPQMMTAISTFYKRGFWDVNKLDQFNDQQLADSIYDFGVNSGTGHAAKMLQGVLGVTADGIIGPGTLAAVNSRDAKTTYDAFAQARAKFYSELAARPGQAKFLKSWMSRIKPYVS